MWTTLRKEWDCVCLGKGGAGGGDFKESDAVWLTNLALCLIDLFENFGGSIPTFNWMIIWKNHENSWSWLMLKIHSIAKEIDSKKRK